MRDDAQEIFTDVHIVRDLEEVKTMKERIIVITGASRGAC